MDVLNKRIAFVIGSMGKGGAERVVSIIANDYAQLGYNGLLTDIGDRVALADAMEYMITHLDAANQMGEHAKEMSKSFAKPSIMKQWTDIIETAIN